MKNRKPLLLLLSVALPIFLFAQEAELKTTVKQLSEMVQSVEAKKYSYGQKLTWDEKRPSHIHFESSRTDEKGKTSSLEQDFNLRYLDERFVRRDNVKDLLVVRVQVKGKDKFVKNSKEGKLDAYESEIEFIANDVNNARDIEELLKKAIPLAQKLPSEIPLPSDYESQINWLLAQVAPAETGEELIDQKMQREEMHASRLILESVRQGKKETEAEQWAFNLIDLDAKNIKLKVDKTKLYVNVPTINENKYIRYLQNARLENYQEDFKIYVTNIETGDALATVISTLAAESSKRFSNKSATTANLSALVQEVAIDDDRYTQTYRQDNCRASLSSSYTKKEESVADEYKVNLADLDPRSVKIEVSKDEVMVTAQVIKKEKFVQLLRNGQPEDFKNEWQIRATDIENARALLEVLPITITNCKGQNECPIKSGDVASLMKTIADQFGEIKINGTIYTQSLRAVEGEANQWEYLRSEDTDKKVKQETFIFNISDLNIKATDYKMSKEVIKITFQTERKEEIIKYLVDDKAEDYKKEMEWLVTDVEMMRAVICAMEAAAANGS